jgi:uncharacterized membrane protein YbhN (UPF0104 family)
MSNCRAAIGLLGHAISSRRRTLWNIFKYLVAVGLLTYVVWSNWGSAEKPNAPATAASTVGLLASPQGQGPLLAGSALCPGRSRNPGSLAYVWQRHVVEGEPIHYYCLALAALIYSASALLTFVRWWYLVRAQDLPFTLPNAIRLGLIGLFFKTCLPGAIGGDIIKAAAIAREQSRRTVAVATILIDRAVALWALVWFVVLLGILFWSLGLFQGEVEAALKSIVRSGAVIIGVSLVFCLLLAVLPAYRAERFAERLGRIPKIGHSAAEAWRAVWMYRCRPGSVLVAMGLSMFGFVGFVLAFYFSARTLTDASLIPSFDQHFLIVPIGMVIEAAPFFPGGAGIGELGYGSLYELLHKPAANGILGSLVKRAITWVVGFVGFLVYLRMRPALSRAAEEAREEVAVPV